MTTPNTGDVIVVTSTIEPFTPVPRRSILDARMTPEALGILTYMIMRAGLEDWKFYVSEIAANFNCGARGDKVRTALRELIDLGYVVREQVRDDRGRVAGYRYLVSDVSATATSAASRPAPTGETPTQRAPATPAPPRPANKKASATSDERLQGLVGIWNATRDTQRTAEKKVLDAKTRGQLRALINDHGDSAEEVLRVATLRINGLARQQGNWWSQNRGGLGNLLPNVTKHYEAGHYEAGVPGQRRAASTPVQDRYVPADVI